jgi:hypothetical protein
MRSQASTGLADLVSCLLNIGFIRIFLWGMSVVEVGELLGFVGVVPVRFLAIAPLFKV